MKLSTPDFADGPPFGRGEEVLQGNVKEGGSGLGEDLVPVADLAVDADPASAAVGHPGRCGERTVDENRTPVADEDARRHRGEAVPCGEEPAGLVEGGADQPAVDDSGRRLVPLAEGEGRLVAVDSLLGRRREVNAVRIVTTTPARRVMVRRDPLYRSPPRSKCAL